MSWLFFAFLAPFFFGAANVLDTYLSNRIFRRPATLVFFSSLFNIFFALCVVFIWRPAFPSFSVLPWILAIGLTDILYLYPYYRALQEGDTSVVSALFTLGKVFTPILAFFLVGEKLTFVQYMGFFIVILGGTLLSVERTRRHISFNAAFWYMALASFLVTLEAVFYKYVFEQGTPWATAVSGGYAAAFGVGLLLLTVPRIRADIISSARAFRRKIPLFALEELFTFTGIGTFAYAVSLAPVSLVRGIDAFSPFFILLAAFALRKALPGVFKEHVERGIIIKKLFLFAVMVAGIVLIVS